RVGVVPARPEHREARRRRGEGLRGHPVTPLRAVTPARAAVPVRGGAPGHAVPPVRAVTAAPEVRGHRQPPAGAVPKAVRASRRRGRRRGRSWGSGLLLVAPSLIALGVFVYGFLGWNLRVSFTSWRGLSPRYDFVGLRNYVMLWHDERWRID